MQTQKPENTWISCLTACNHNIIWVWGFRGLVKKTWIWAQGNMLPSLLTVWTYWTTKWQKMQTQKPDNTCIPCLTVCSLDIIWLWEARIYGPKSLDLGPRQQSVCKEVQEKKLYVCTTSLPSLANSLNLWTTKKARKCKHKYQKHLHFRSHFMQSGHNLTLIGQHIWSKKPGFGPKAKVCFT